MDRYALNPTRRDARDSIRILALPGSLRRDSSNRLLLQAAAERAANNVQIEVFDAVASIPPFNEDDEATFRYGSSVVQRLRRAVAATDGLLIATPEYNQSVPGVLKNVIDWLSRPDPEEVLRGKPVAIIGASSGPWGTRLAQKELRHVLNATESLVMPSPTLFARNSEPLFNANGQLADSKTAGKLSAVLTAFTAWIMRLGLPVSYEASTDLRKL